MLNHHHHRLPLIRNLFNSFSIFTLFCKSFLRSISYDIWDIFPACYQSIDIEICFFKIFVIVRRVNRIKVHCWPSIKRHSSAGCLSTLCFHGRAKCRFCRIEWASIFRRINASFFTFIAFLFSFTTHVTNKRILDAARCVYFATVGIVAHLTKKT